MGLFSGTKTIVYSNSFHMMETEVNAQADAVLYAILAGESISNSLSNVALNGMTLKVERMRAYAEKEYTLGLPAGSRNKTIILDDADVAEAITTDLSAPYGVVVDFNFVNLLLINHVAVPYLISVRSWNNGTNAVGVPPAGLTYPVSPEGLRASYRVSVNSIKLSTNKLNIEITYKINAYHVVWSGSRDDGYYSTTYNYSTTYFQEDYVIPTGFMFGKEYCIAGYRILDSLGAPGAALNWWFYAIDSQVYPTLSAEEGIDDTNNALPVIPIRYNNLSMTREAVQETELYLTSKRLLKMLKIDIDQVTTSLEENPNIADIDHAYIMFGVDLQTTNNESIRYLAEFFDYLSDISAVSMLENIGYTIRRESAPQNSYFFTKTVREPEIATSSHSWTGANGETIVTRITNDISISTMIEHGLDVQIVYSHIDSQIVAGSIGPVGTATKQIIRQADPVLLRGDYAAWDGSSLVLKLQVATNTYKQVTVTGLGHKNNIYGGHAVLTTLADVYDSADEHNFIIPIHYGVSKKLPILSRNILYQESLIMVLNSVVITSVSWYATGFFRFLIMAVTLIIVAFTQQAWLLKLGVAATEGLIAVLLYILPDVLISLMVSIALDFIAKVVGPEFMAILSIVIAVVAIAYGPKASFNFIGKSLPTAQTFLYLSSALMSSAQKELGRLIGEISDEFDIFKKEAETETEKLEAALELLEGPSDQVINLLEAQTHIFQFHSESGDPQKFYNMTIHTGNIGTLALNVVQNFHDIMLKLPEVDNTASRNMLGTV